MSNEAKPALSIDWNKALRRLTLIIGIGVVLNLFFTYFLSGDFQWSKFIAFRPEYLLAAFILAIYPWIAHAWEIMIWSNFFRKPMSFRDATTVSVATDLGAAITPTMVGGAPIKLGMLMRKGLKSGQAAAMVIFTGIEDMIFMILMVPLSVWLSDRIGVDVLWRTLFAEGSGMLRTLIVVAILAVLVVLAGMLLSKWSFGRKLRNKVKEILKEFMEAMAMIGSRGKGHFLLATLAIISRWISRFLILVCLVKGLEIDTSYAELFLNEWMVYVGMTVTPTPGAIGGAEGAFYLVYKNLLPTDDIGVIITVWRFFNYYLLLILSAIFLNVIMHRKKV